MTVKNIVIPCSLVDVHRDFGGRYCVHLQGRRVNQARNNGDKFLRNVRLSPNCTKLQSIRAPTIPVIVVDLRSFTELPVSLDLGLFLAMAHLTAQPFRGGGTKGYLAAQSLSFGQRMPNALPPLWGLCLYRICFKAYERLVLLCVLFLLICIAMETLTPLLSFRSIYSQKM